MRVDRDVHGTTYARGDRALVGPESCPGFVTERQICPCHKDIWKIRIPAVLRTNRIAV
jgi:hypothetical protein